MLRNSTIDKTKLLMIFLVVFGHLIEPIISQSDVLKSIYKSIYSFHMPVFIILAGAFTKLEISESNISKNLQTLVVPFITFTVLYEIYSIIIEGSISSYTLNWQPYWILWFLFSLFIWKTTLPIIMQFRFPLTLSILLSLGAGYISDVGYFLGVSRTLYFFPFFILGYKLGPTLLSNNLLLRIPKLLYFLIIIMNVLFFWLYSDLPYQWLYGSFSYFRIGDVEWYSFVTRLMLYFISIATSIALIMLLPNSKTRFAVRGQNSFFVYVWHGFFIKLVMFFGIYQVVSGISTILAIVTLFIIAIVITALLSTVFVANLTNKYILLPAKYLFLVKR